MNAFETGLDIAWFAVVAASCGHKIYLGETGWAVAYGAIATLFLLALIGKLVVR
jgi:TM2 domain-containing membrane protein YozV